MNREQLIKEGKATVEDMIRLHKLGYVVQINDGKVVKIEKE